MWKSINFLTLHYAWIITLSILSLVIIYPYGNLKAIDAYFFGASASTESGLNTFDVKDLKTYQQVYIYIIPVVSNLGFINIAVVIFRARWFEKHLKATAPHLLRPETLPGRDAEAQFKQGNLSSTVDRVPSDRFRDRKSDGLEEDKGPDEAPEKAPRVSQEQQAKADDIADSNINSGKQVIHFADESLSDKDQVLYIPPPWKRDRGTSFSEIDGRVDDDDDEQTEKLSRRQTTRSMHSPRTLERVVTSMFVLGNSPSQEQSQKTTQNDMKQLDLPNISSHATIGRNSQFHNLSAEDRERLGGIEYRSLKLLLKIVVGYFFGLHLFGAICLVGWIRYADPKYRDYLAECGQGNVWWGFYSAQTMIDNLGFTLTPDSMISFQDATFPMILMSFLAFAGNTCYPCLLRLIIWTMSKVCHSRSSLKDPLRFLLDHPRRCYTLLFPSRPTWILFGILVLMNSIDVILILVLDLNNPAVNNLAPGPRVLAAIFQAASARHTGASTFNLADVNPAVQFSLVIMMYIAIFPIAISIRASNVYEERTLGIYGNNVDVDESDGRSYIINHIQNQLSFDLWYIFLGCFCICIAEAGKIADTSIPAFSVFSVLFEVVSAYGNVGLSLGYPTVSTSLCGEFTVFSKLVVCVMMIRGRHRGLPYKLDRAIVLPGERLEEDHHDRDEVQTQRRLEEKSQTTC
ncbi:Potassium transport protein high-affinity [Penicillium concentricum]|uniref:Potassium transport protein high-affinity n=1 Tax=Penicillium concentricum TaxID=293559 RepID=A0A9W9S8D2_9EURO|nr:Potassium transport protein high-affinity [Penicillium concentricum]KAJ5373833.1 Potassium transport protein high-affinity [Penicillium concentricum]